MKWFKLLLFSTVTILVFFLGRQIGKDSKHVDCSQITPKNHEVVRTPTAEVPKCTTVIPPKKETPRPALCYNLNNRSIVPFRKGDASVPTDIFSFLHHPASPAKIAFFLTRFSKWKSNKVQDSPCQEIYLTRTGSRASQPNKCVSVVVVPNGFNSINQQSHRVGYTALNTDQYQKDFPVDYDEKNNPEQVLLFPFLQNRERIINIIRSKLGTPIDERTGLRRRIILMVANEGVMDLLLNFMCSAEGAKIDLRSVLVFVGDSKYVAVVEKMGGNAIYDPTLGSMPTRAAGVYLDHTFSRMMWFKAVSVYLTLCAGYEVLFQDVDLVWLKDPFEYLENIDSDIIFMDDGARTPRYTPFFVNSGFYFVKHNNRTLFMFETFTKSAASEIGRTHSHQSVLIRHISEAHHLFGLKIFVLDSTLFCSGQAYHENKPLIRKIQAKTFKPFVFHMCWTDNRENKVVYFKDVGLWYLNENDKACSSPQGLYNYAAAPAAATIRDRCCNRPLYWPATSQ